MRSPTRYDGRHALSALRSRKHGPNGAYERHFLSKLTDADGEQQETQHWIDTAADCGYLTEQQAALLIRKCEEIGRLLGGMMAKADLFCGEPVYALRESAAEYFVEEPVISDQ